MKDVKEIGTQYFDIPSKEVANHIKKWLATLNFKERGNDGWTDKNRRIFFTYPDNEYLFTSTEDNQSWEKLYDYGMPKYLGNQISAPKITLTEDNIRDFYFEVNNQTEADDALEILEKASEVIYIKGLAFLYDSWRYIIYANGSGWKLSHNSIGNKSTYQELVNLYKPKETMQLHSNVSINGKLPNDKIVYVNDLVGEAMSLFSIDDSFLDLVHKKKSKIISHKYSYYFSNDSLYVEVSNDTNDKTQRIYQEGKWAIKVNNLLEQCKKRYPIGTKFRPAHSNSKEHFCIITTENFRVDNDKTIYAKLINNGIYESSPYKHGNTDYNRSVYYNGNWAEILEDELPNSATSSKNIRDLKYPDVVHIENREDYDILESFHSTLSGWKNSYKYYLIGGGASAERKPYGNGNYTIYEMDQIIMDEQVKTDDIEIFPGIKIGDIVVSLVNKGQYRKIGDMFEVLSNSREGCLYYSDTNSNESDSFRLATYEESEEYEKGIRNINVLPIETSLERANRMYPKGTKVKLLAGTDGTSEGRIIQKKFILYDNGSISYPGLPGYVYCSKTNQWAEIIKDSKPKIIVDVESTSKSTVHDFKVDDYVKIVTLKDERLAYKKILGEVFQVTEVYNKDLLNKYVKGYKESYPHLFNTDTGVFMTDIRLATQDEINQYNLEKAKRFYPPGTIVKWESISNTGIVPYNPEYKIYDGNEIGIPYMTSYLFNEKWAKIVGVSYISEDLHNLPNDIDLKCKSSKQYINTTIASIPTINKELKQKKQKFYF